MEFKNVILFVVIIVLLIIIVNYISSDISTLTGLVAGTTQQIRIAVILHILFGFILMIGIIVMENPK